MPFRIKTRWVVRYTSLCVVGGAIQLAMIPWAYAKVVVLANRTAAVLTITALPTGQPAREVSLGPGDARPVYFDRQLRVRYNFQPRRGADNHSGGAAPSKSQEHLLEDASAYYFAISSDDTLVFEKIGLGENGSRQTSDRQSAYDRGEFFPASEEATTIPVKILVDDDELRHRRVWEPHLRKRIANASRVLEAHSGVRLRVVAVDTWDSDDDQNDFFQSLRELEREVSPKPGRLAIGFSSQYRIAHGRVHMGGTRGALHSHILLKERSPKVRETERLELLVHELGHYLGASHSPEPDSVMRPVISGGLQRRVDVHIQFDPVNTLLIAMMGDEIRHRRVRKLADLSLPTKRRMRQIQTVLVKALPDDPAAGHFVQLLGAATTGPLLEATDKILQQIVRVAKLRSKAESGNRKAESGAGSVPISGQQLDQAAGHASRKLGPDPLHGESLLDDQGQIAEPGVAAMAGDAGQLKTKTKSSRTDGDQLTEFYVRQAALAAQQVRREYAQSAYLLALGIAMDDTQMLRRLPWIEPIVRRIESDRQRRERVQVLGSPTMRGRRDLTRHFFVSALSVVVHGSRATSGAGIAKELFDAQAGSGFSFADMAANRSGIAFAVAVLGKKITLADVAQGFRVDAFLPPLDGFTEGLTASQLQRKYGGFGDRRFTEELTRIDRRVMALPVYQRLRGSRQ